MTLGLDTNILAYAEGVNDETMRDRALDVIEALSTESLVVPIQVLGELFRVLVGKAGRKPEEARSAVLAWHDVFPVAPTTDKALLIGADLTINPGFGIWDGIIFGVAAVADCRLLLSQDLPDGFTAHGLTVVNPFAVRLHPLLSAMMRR